VASLGKIDILAGYCPSYLVCYVLFSSLNAEIGSRYPDDWIFCINMDMS